MPTLTVRRPERDSLANRTLHPTVPPQAEYEPTTTGHSHTHPVKTLPDRSAQHHDAIAQARQKRDAEHPDSAIR
jgi:DNA-binding HxlR family transcriptional regulator